MSAPVRCHQAPEGGTRSPFAQTDFNKGVQRINARNYEEAITYFDKAIERDDQFAMAYYARGVCHRELKRNEAALSDLNAAVRAAPSLLDAHALRGVIRNEAQQADQALEDFNYVLDHRPGDAQSLLSRGVIYLNQRKLESAENDFRVFIKLYPKDALAPRLRKILASLASEANPPPLTPHRRSEEEAEGARTRASADPQQLAAELMLKMHRLSETYNQKVIRGERTQAVGSLEDSEIPLHKD